MMFAVIFCYQTSIYILTSCDCLFLSIFIIHTFNINIPLWSHSLIGLDFIILSSLRDKCVEYNIIGIACIIEASSNKRNTIKSAITEKSMSIALHWKFFANRVSTVVSTQVQ